VDAVFFLSVAAVFYTLGGYPLLTWLAGIFFAKRIRSRDEFVPSVSILVSAYNEEGTVRRKLENLLALDYPPEKAEILIGSDGSTDGTPRILEKYAGNRIRVFSFPSRRGKPSVLNDLAGEARGELLVFADCRQVWNTDALKYLVRPFADSRVGVVSGVVREEKDGIYRRYDDFVRQQASRLGSVPGACGSIYAVRKETFVPFPPEMILDDLFLPMELLRKRFFSVVEPRAVARDISFPLSVERVRKVRTIAGNFQYFFRYPQMLLPWVNPAWFHTLSHKVFRLFLPVFLAALFVSNAACVARHPAYAILFLVQAAGYAAGAAGTVLMRRKQPSAAALPAQMLHAAAVFVEFNAMTVAAFFLYLRGKATVLWETSKEVV